ncbi:hypothetical protein WICANDRAFT_62414 [Wickerhamomyces anomalus NRRL Y-366-8]|uniref:Peptide hydrolase n=1 Tax=Wickerhamomyces anomalus (strain ATCC 58044 / CBS 1984 / NCYC 433 / NRRL Y-366-8) TaxID=683960 RepID=A0A1E3P4Q2_WICAA|nr:uncharacterized protein WICANDRAFT_62414 [Wickerhamomyces anomalus NRRL Y-366-8]ODQ59827.1 hypothetical protein WICANDRAFT_62414 [Wickerhamomyces anomalus NRRL Y-366-8]
MKLALSTLLSISAASAYLLPFSIPDAQQIFALKTPEAGDNIKTPYEELPLIETEALQDLITVEALNASAIELYKIANASLGQYGHPKRVNGSPGHWKTIAFIIEELKGLKDYFTFETQEFEALDGKVFNYSLSVNGSDIGTVKPFQLTPPVHYLHGELFAVKNNGCSEDDYEGLDPTKKQVALIERGVCAFGDKSSLAGKLGAKAVLIYDNESPTSIISGTLGEPTNTTVGTLGIQRGLALVLLQIIAAGEKVPVTVNINSYVGLIKTKNVVAETIYGDHENVVALGAHSDSVAAGPGINDDGSGTISLLTVAKELSKFQINNAVRFAWWAAEEEGLLGSNYYASNLTPEENHKIRLFMDYDMMASPNFEYQVYNGSNAVNPVGSEELKNLYIDWYEEHNKNWTLIPFDGRSDYVGFIENDIPGGGIAAGAEGKNSQNGKVLDKCYHLLCDDSTNLNWDAFFTNTKLIAHSVAVYAKDLSGFPARNTIEAKSIPEFKYRGSHLII